jgi:hypothetical protein
MYYNEIRNIICLRMLIRKISIIVFAFFVWCFLLLSSSQVYAATLNIIRPYQGERVTGVYEIGWSVFDTGQATTPYELRLKNSSCSDAGTALASSGFSSSIANGFYSHIWNTNSVVDSTYCLQLCVVLDNGASQCAHRVLSIVNNTNNNPVITSYPQRLNYKSNEAFKYQISAYDPDGDAINYKILSAPDFIFLDQNGYMSIGSYMTPGTYNISLAVIDSKGGATQQSFALVVTQYVPPTPVPTAKPASTITPTPTPKPVAQQIKMEITKPAASSVFQGRSNSIEWKYSNLDSTKVKEVILEYSRFQPSNFEQITKYTSGITNTYTWDVSSIENGEYLVRVSLVGDDSSLLAQVTSDKFLIANRQDEPNLLSIFNLKPENKSIVEDSRPEISANFAGAESNEVTKQSVVVKVDKKEITKLCSIQGDSFKCSLDFDLKDGEHSVEVKLSDSSGQTLEQAWVFSVKTGGQGNQDDPIDGGGLFGNIDFDDLKAIYPWCGGLLLIVLLVFVIAVLSKKKSNVDPFYSNNNSFGGSKPSLTVDNMGFDDLSDIESQLDYSPNTTSTSVGASSEPGQDDIPDWLKGTSDDEARPVGTDGEQVGGLLPGDSDSAEVHDNFGMTASE